MTLPNDLPHFNEWGLTPKRVRDRIEQLETKLSDLDEQNMMFQDYLRQIRGAAAIEYAQGLAEEAIERSR